MSEKRYRRDMVLFASSQYSKRRSAPGASPISAPRADSPPSSQRRRRRQPADSVAPTLGEPDPAVRSRGQSERFASGLRQGELGDVAGKRDPADLVAERLGDPEPAIHSGRDGLRLAPGR